MDEYTRSVSHTWKLKLVKIRRPAGGHKDSAAKPHRFSRLSRRDPTQWTDLRVRYAGGSSGWVIVMARGRVVPYPADAWLLNVVLDITQSHG